jgi:hypothetical protein
VAAPGAAAARDHRLRARPARRRRTWVTADELAEIGRELLAVTDKYFERQTRPELRPPGSRLATYLHLGFPNKTLADDTLPDDTPAGDE